MKQIISTKTIILTILGIGIVTAFLFPGLSYALELDNPLDADTFEGLVDGIIDFLFIVAMAVGPLLIVLGGFYYVTAAGSMEKIETAKRIILYTVIGMSIILLSKVFVSVLGEIMKLDT